MVKELAEWTKKQIRRKKRQGIPDKDIARMFGISVGSVKNIHTSRWYDYNKKHSYKQMG